MSKKHYGFTLIELLVVIAVMAILITISVTTFVNLNHSQALERITAQVTALIQETRSKAQTSKGDSEYGVHLLTDKVIAFAGSVYNADDTSNIILSLDDVILTATSSIVGGGYDLIFKKISGATVNAGSFNLSLQSLPSSFKTVKIEGTGLISVQ